ncbi:MAG: 7-cyano-7-deazaguanine synthase [Candidatus Aenigmarchaeota archaeon]|nr:7-cyano-7-deazaguanine synthase [Candidatus Aenigmarchaeota archaeon]
MKLISLISGGIDSPVASYMMMKKGAEIVFVHLDTRPFSDDASFKKAKKLVETLAKKSKKKVKLYIVPYGKIQAEIEKKAPRKLTCILCRRTMLEIAQRIAKKEKAYGLITGESLGQVASQTLDNIYAADAMMKIPIFRPLIGFDKEETIEIAKEIGTYDLSILPSQCCNLAPQHPETHSKMKEVEEAVKKIDTDTLSDAAVSKAQVIEIS